jgi:hypothetical protein
VPSGSNSTTRLLSRSETKTCPVRTLIATSAGERNWVSPPAAGPPAPDRRPRGAEDLDAVVAGVGDVDLLAPRRLGVDGDALRVLQLVGAGAGGAPRPLEPDRRARAAAPVPGADQPVAALAAAGAGAPLAPARAGSPVPRAAAVHAGQAGAAVAVRAAAGAPFAAAPRGGGHGIVGGRGRGARVVLPGGGRGNGQGLRRRRRTGGRGRGGRGPPRAGRANRSNPDSFMVASFLPPAPRWPVRVGRAATPPRGAQRVRCLQRAAGVRCFAVGLAACSSPINAGSRIQAGPSEPLAQSRRPTKPGGAPGTGIAPVLPAIAHVPRGSQHRDARQAVLEGPRRRLQADGRRQAWGAAWRRDGSRPSRWSGGPLTTLADAPRPPAWGDVPSAPHGPQR